MNSANRLKGDDGEPVRLRAYRIQDAGILAEVYRDSVRAIGPQWYDQTQVDVWAMYPEDLDEFRTRLARGHTLIAEAESGQALAFGQLDPEDHLAFLYCLGTHGRRGIGSMLYKALEDRAVRAGSGRIRTEASRISRPFFAKHGFEVIEVEHVDRHGVGFERFRMRKELGQVD